MESVLLLHGVKVGVISCRISGCYFPLPLVPSRRGRGKFTPYETIKNNLIKSMDESIDHVQGFAVMFKHDALKVSVLWYLSKYARIPRSSAAGYFTQT